MEENTGRTLFGIKCSKIFFEQSPRAMNIKTKRNKWDLIKPKSFCKAKETINKTKTTTLRMGENIGSETKDKRKIPKIYKLLMQLNIKKQTNQSKNGQKT